MRPGYYLIFDGNNLLWQAVTGRDGTGCVTPDGFNLKGLINTLRVLRTVYSSRDTIGAIVVFDGGLSQRRLNLYPDYKRRNPLKGSDKDEESLALFRETQECLCEILPHLGIPVLMYPNREADDVIYKAVELAILETEIAEILVYSSDKDLYQVLRHNGNVCGSRVTIMPGYSSSIVTSGNYRLDIDVPLKWLALRKAISGKGIEWPGLQGIAESTTEKLLKRMEELQVGDCENFDATYALILDAVESMSGSGFGGERGKELQRGRDRIYTGLQLCDLSYELFDQEIKDLVSWIRRSVDPNRITNFNINELQFYVFRFQLHLYQFSLHELLNAFNPVGFIGKQ